MPLSKTKILECEVFVYSYVARMFSMFCNQKNRGEKFLWVRFTDMIGRLVVNQAYFSFSHRYKKDLPEIQAYVKKLTETVANRMIEDSGFLELETKKNPKVTTKDFKSLVEATERKRASR